MNDIIQKTRKDYNKIAKYFSGTRYDVWPELLQFKKLIKDGQNILDWGCGNGRLLLLLRGKKIKYFGADQSGSLLRIARKKYSREIKEGTAKFFYTAKKQLSFPADFFDLAFMIASFHHLPDKNSRLEILKTIFNRMKKNGTLIITVWNLRSDWAKEKNKGWEKISRNDFLIPWKNPQGKIECERYYHNFSKKELGGLLTDAGFKVEKLEYSGINNWTDSKSGRNLIAIAKKI